MPLGLINQQEVFTFALADGLDRPLIPYDRARGGAKPKAGKVAQAPLPGRGTSTSCCQRLPLQYPHR